MARFLASAVFSSGLTVAMYDGRTPQAVVYKTQKGDSKKRRRSDVLEGHGSRLEKRRSTRLVVRSSHRPWSSTCRTTVTVRANPVHL